MHGCIVRFSETVFWLPTADDLPAYLLTHFGISGCDFWLSGNSVNLRLLGGGKGGFGRAMRQEGERRSRRLPPFKDACRTLSGKRIGLLKAKQKLQRLRERIVEMEQNRTDLQALKTRSNVHHEIEVIEQKQADIAEELRKAVEEGNTRQVPNGEGRSPVIDDFALLFEKEE
jgi:hypothetical protein